MVFLLDEFGKIIETFDTEGQALMYAAINGVSKFTIESL